MERESIRVDVETAEVWQAAEHRRALDLMALLANCLQAWRTKAVKTGDTIPAGRTIGRAGEA